MAGGKKKIAKSTVAGTAGKKKGAVGATANLASQATTAAAAA
eukprot:CAMPEP_0174842366 /NCGR_PEP_ID=MMETSP1114-20130205/9871_1 /TAXON_ID=312471 /ORGANISM="Neobodo designis, Strain CCAP 1951/1" /LENGTH=41 /DNA_ID= /DNA_START= /DNA_END= /DNA_ORIENTATION=